MADDPVPSPLSSRPPDVDPDAADRLTQLWRRGARPDLDAFLAQFGPLPNVQLVSVLRVDQKHRWEIGEYIPVEAYLARYSSLLEDRDQVVDLLYAEYLLRERLGRTPRIEEFAWRFPDYGDVLRDQIELHQALNATGHVQLELSPTATDLATPASLGAPTAAPSLPSVPGYEVLELAGRGGMGVVYKARHRQLDRVVALKMLPGVAAVHPELRARFQREARATARLVHPHIVTVYEVGEHEGQPYFSLQFVEGQTLADRLHAGPLEAREAARLLLAVSEAIAEAHRHNILHRDLKPSNILIDSGGRPLVADFGLAKWLEDTPDRTRSEAVVGTPSYMTPEQAAGKTSRIGVASDIYSLGAVLYHMLTGRPPFQGGSAAETVRMVIEDEPRPVGQVNPQADGDLELIAMKCLQKTIAHRYATATALADDLRAYLNGDVLSVRRSPLRRSIARVFRDTHHSPVLENWGLAFMVNGVVFLAMCLVGDVMYSQGVVSPLAYAGLWAGGSFVMSLMVYRLRQPFGPITYIERQCGHLWFVSVLGACAVPFIEVAMGLPTLALAPMYALVSSMNFFLMASFLAGSYYAAAAANLVSVISMAVFPYHALVQHGLVAGGSSFLQGWRYFRRRRGAAIVGRTGVQPGCQDPLGH